MAAVSLPRFPGSSETGRPLQDQEGRDEGDGDQESHGHAEGAEDAEIEDHTDLGKGQGTETGDRGDRRHPDAEARAGHGQPHRLRLVQTVAERLLIPRHDMDPIGRTDADQEHRHDVIDEREGAPQQGHDAEGPGHAHQHGGQGQEDPLQIAETQEEDRRDRQEDDGEEDGHIAAERAVDLFVHDQGTGEIDPEIAFGAVHISPDPVQSGQGLFEGVRVGQVDRDDRGSPVPGDEAPGVPGVGHNPVP